MTRIKELINQLAKDCSQIGKDYYTRDTIQGVTENEELESRAYATTRELEKILRDLFD